MFYSHEVLTSRKYGVATVWLVATLGAKSTLKKVNRKAIREVDVPKACRTIVDPGAPMALRLQGNLLYGVSRVYFEQCDYVLSDAQNAHNAMRMMIQAVKNAALDPAAGKAKPDQLILPDDPSFLPDFALPPPELLATLNLPLPAGTPHAGDSLSLTPFGSQHDQGTPVGSVRGLILPSSSPGAVGEFRVQGDDGPGSVGGQSDIPGEAMVEPLVEPDFGFDDDGNFIQYSEGEGIAATPAGPPGTMMPSDAGASVRVRQEHEEGQAAGPDQFDDHMDLDLPVFGDDLPEGEAFPTPQPAAERHDEPETSSPVAASMQRKKRAAKVLPADTTMELRNKDLADWNNGYLRNMAEARRQKEAHRAASLAKKNAEYWVWGAGIGGIGSLLTGRSVTGPTPFDRLHGDNLFELFTGVNRKALAGTKHDRDSGIDEETQDQSRRVRHKTDEPEEQLGRADDDDEMMMPGDEDGMGMPGDDDVELPREAPSALDDQLIFSEMPWNVSASIRGSSAIPRSGRVGMLASASTGAQGSLRHRASRVVSASPLHGRGRAGGLGALESLGGEDDFGDFGLPAQPSSDFEPEGMPSVRVREALSAEGENFLTFVSDAIAEKRDQIQEGLQEMSDVLQAEAAADVDEVLFEELLPPAENTKMVACQGLMMVLALGTKGLLNVRQDGGFKDIGLSLTDKAKGMQVGEEAEEEDGDAEEGVEEGEGHFEEQMAAGAGGETEDDNDSLYGL